MALQEDFGGFDGRFFGVAIKVQTKDQFDLITGSSALDSAAVEQLARGDPEKHFELVTAATVLVHEWRHFHDFLLSPLGAAVFRARLQATANALTVIAELSRSHGRRQVNCLAVPLSMWERLPEPERAAFLTSTQEWLAAAGLPTTFAPLTLPQDVSRDPKDIAAMDDALISGGLLAIHFFDRIRTLLAGPPDLYTTVHVAEASALIVQAQDIWSAFGEMSVKNFMLQLIERARRKQTYGLALVPLVRYKEDDDEAKPSIRSVGAAYTWALLGDPVAESVDVASPGYRLGRLLQHVRTNGYPEDADTDVFATFEQWDAAAGVGPTLINLARSTRLDNATAEESERAYGDEELRAPLVSLALSFARAREAMVEQFLADPTSYTAARRYLDELAAFPAPLTAFALTGGTFAVDAAEASRLGLTVISSRQAADGVERPYIVALPTPPGASASVDLATAQGALYLAQLADVVACDFSEPDIGAFDNLRTILEPEIRVLLAPAHAM